MVIVFFCAILHQLCGLENDHLSLRSATLNYLFNNMNIFAPFVHELYSTIENHIEQMSKNSTYVDYLTISAATVAINKNMVVHELGHKPLFILGSDFLDYLFHVWHDSGPLLHYQSDICIDDGTLFLSFEHIVST